MASTKPGAVQSEIATALNIPIFQKWVHAYKAHGQKSLTKTYTHYPDTFKVSVLQSMQQDQLSIRCKPQPALICASPSTISLWQRLYNEGAITALEPKPKGRPPMSKPFKPFTPTNKPVTQMTAQELMQELEFPLEWRLTT